MEESGSVHRFSGARARGFIIKSKADEVKIFGDYVPIHAPVAALQQFSDHADPPELLQWLRTLAIVRRRHM